MQRSWCERQFVCRGEVCLALEVRRVDLNGALLILDQDHSGRTETIQK